MLPPECCVLVITEPDVGSKRVVQVTGLPFTVGSGPEAAVRLLTAGIPCVRIEEREGEHFAVDCGGGALRVRGDAVSQAALRPGEVFAAGTVTLRFFPESAESLRARLRPPLGPAVPARSLRPRLGTKDIEEYLASLERVEGRLRELRTACRELRTSLV